MFTGSYELIDPTRFDAVRAAMAPIGLNPQTRYFLAASLLPGSDFGGERRFGLPVSELLTPDAVGRATKAAANEESAAKREALLPGDTLAVLNYGFVEYMDVMGDDDAIADAARTSYTGGKRSRANAGLLRYLLRHQHTTPFEMGELKFRVYIPIFVYRQMFRHRTASQLEPEVADCISNDTAFQTFSVQNEMSGRYVELPDHYYLPDLAAVQKQSLDNKQGRDDNSFSPAEQAAIRARFEREVSTMRDWYKTSLDGDLAKELARANLPLSQYTLLIWKIDLKNLLHFIALRLHPHAQYEVREYARALYAVVRSAFPVTATAFDDYVLSGARFTKQELAALRESLTVEQRRALYERLCATVGNERERAEFLQKIGLPEA